MRKIRMQGNVKIYGVKNFGTARKRIDYYLVVCGYEEIYAFSAAYSRRNYDLCKSGLMVNDLASLRCRSKATMTLVNRVNRMLPYLAEEYELPIAG